MKVIRRRLNTAPNITIDLGDGPVNVSYDQLNIVDKGKIIFEGTDLVRGDRQLGQDLINQKIVSIKWKSKTDYNKKKSPEIKYVFTNSRGLNAKLNKPEDLTMDTLGELPAYVYKQYFNPESLNYDKIVKYGMRGPKLDKKALKEELTKLIKSNYTSLETLRSELADYFKTKGNKYNPDTIYAKLKNSRKVPNIRVKNVWQYLAGKIGSTAAYFTTLKESYPDDPESKFTTNIGGYEVYYTESKPKEISKLPTWMAFVEGKFNDGDRYKVMPANEIVNYLDKYDDQVFDLYKI